MVPEKGCFPFVFLAVLIALDCYLDDLAAALGIPSELIFEPPGESISALMLLSVSILALAAVTLYLVYRWLRPAGLFQVAYVLLSAYAIAVALGNTLVRIALLARDSAVSQSTTPQAFFVQTYATRLSVYAVISATSALLIVTIARWGPGRRRFIGAFLLLAAVAAASASLLAGGIQTLAASPYWEGDSILNGKIYMGTFPRQYANLMEPWVTGAFLVGFLLIVIDIPKRPDWTTLCPPLCVAGATLVQVLPRIGRGLVTEALYGADFYYSFRLDRSLAFPILPLLILSLAVLVARVLPRKAQVPGAGFGNT